MYEYLACTNKTMLWDDLITALCDKTIEYSKVIIWLINKK